jgi:hypothetical protein
VNLDAPGPVAGGGYGEEYLGPAVLLWASSRSASLSASVDSPVTETGRVLARGRSGFVEDPVQVSQSQQRVPLPVVWRR